MGKRSRRRRGSGPDQVAAPQSDYRDAEGNVLTLRSSMTAATRRAYAQTLSGSPLSREDAWQRAVEFLFERLAVRWVIAEVPLDDQKQLLGRYRMSGQDERGWIRGVLREHLREHFPELDAP